MPVFKTRLPQIGSIILPMLGLAAWAHNSWNDELDRASAIAERSVAISREYVLRAIQTADSAINQADILTRGMSPADLATASVHDALKEIDEGSDLPSGIGIVGPAGRHLNSSMSFPVSIDLSDREYFIATRDGAPEPYVSAPIKTRISGLETIPISRRRGGDDFQGVIVANLPVNVLVGFFEKLKRDDETIVSVAREDGVLLARWPAIPSFQLRPDTPFMRAIAEGDQGIYRGIAAADHKDRLYAFARVGDLPVFAVYGFSVSALWTAWLGKLFAAAGFTAVTSMLLFLMASRTLMVQREVEARTAELKAALAEKNVLLREVHHRVKNNLAMMASMVRVVGRKASPDLQSHFREISQRITTVGKIYDQVHRSGDLNAFDAATYLREVCRDIVKAFGRDNVRLTLDISSLDLDVDAALPLGLIASEFITNALKHGLGNAAAGEITVCAKQLEDKGFFAVSDNGCGLPEEVRADSAGLRLVELLAQQIGGAVESRPRTGGGAEFSITFRTGSKRVA